MAGAPTGLTVHEVKRNRPVSASPVAVPPFHGLRSRLRASVSPGHGAAAPRAGPVSETHDAVSEPDGAGSPVTACRFAMPVVVSSSHAGAPSAHVSVSNRHADVSQ